MAAKCTVHYHVKHSQVLLRLCRGVLPKAGCEHVRDYLSDPKGFSSRKTNGLANQLSTLKASLNLLRLSWGDVPDSSEICDFWLRRVCVPKEWVRIDASAIEEGDTETARPIGR